MKEMTRDILIQDYAEIIDNQKVELAKLKAIINATLAEIPTGYSPDHNQENLPNLVKRWIQNAVLVDKENKSLKDRNEKLSKRHPTVEEAIAQYHWLKENSKRKELI